MQDRELAEPVLGAVLAALMQRGAESTVDVRAAAVERVEASDLDPVRKRVLIDSIHAYLALNPREEAEYRRRTTRGGKTMEAVELIWSEQIEQRGIERGIEQGIEQGAVQASRAMLEQVIGTRFGSVPAPLAARIADADRETLDRLFTRALLASSVDELGNE